MTDFTSRKASRGGVKPGDRFSRLVVIEGAEAMRLKCVCKCDCGKQHVVRAAELVYGGTRSCGCLAREVASKKHLIHGETTRQRISAEWLAWRNMTKRCLDQKNPRYGGRGITVCDRWRNSFQNFLADMGRKPSPAHSLDRIDNDAGYSPENCRWATDQEQANNRNSNKFLSLGGKRLTITQWSAITKLRPDCMMARKKRGWSDEKTLTTPIQ